MVLGHLLPQKDQRTTSQGSPPQWASLEQFFSMAGKAELGKKSPQQGMGKLLLTAALGKHLCCGCHLGASPPDAQEGVVAEELGSLPPSKVGSFPWMQ